MSKTTQHHDSVGSKFVSFIMMIFGGFLVAFALEIFLIPNQIIDGGVVGLSILVSRYIDGEFLYPLVLLLNLPFIIFAYRSMSTRLVLRMFFAVTAFALSGFLLKHYGSWFSLVPYEGDLLEIVVIGGMLLGAGAGLVIRAGGCLDGTEILGILLNKKYQVSVGKVVLIANVFIFGIAGFVFGDWHPSIKSLITFLVVMKVMDIVIMGLDEMKSITVITKKPKDVGDALMHELGLGLTILFGKGGFSGERTDVLFLIAERLQLSEIKKVILGNDPQAVIAIENLNEVASSNPHALTTKNLNKKERRYPQKIRAPFPKKKNEPQFKPRKPETL